MFDGKIIKNIEVKKDGAFVESVTFIFTDETNLTIDGNGGNSLFFSTFDSKSKRSSIIHPANINR